MNNPTPQNHQPPQHVMEQFRAAIGFLTILPVGSRTFSLSKVAEGMFLFPLVGGFLGLLSGFLAIILRMFLPPLIVALLTFGFLLMLTGLQHFDGLLDFGDGIMTQGTPEDKIKAMRDASTGVGGWTLAIFTFLLTTLTLNELINFGIIQALVTAEVTAKFSMVLLASTGKTASPGTASLFTELMHTKHGYLKTIVALGFSMAVLTMFLDLRLFIAFAAGILTSVLIHGVAKRHFHGLTGDVFGADNELVRAASLLIMVGIVRWV